MTGPEHYREAARLLRDIGIPGNPDAQDRMAMDAAQVHATLALTAATVAERGIGPEETSGWRAFHTDPVWLEATS